MNFPNGHHIAVIYRRPVYGEPDWLHLAREGVLRESEKSSLTPTITRRFYIQLDNACCVDFIDEKNQEREARGRTFNSVLLFPPAETIGENIRRSIHN